MISARCRSKIRGALGRFTEGNFAANARNLLPGAIVKTEGHRDQEVSPTQKKSRLVSLSADPTHHAVHRRAD